ncbi:DMT family transporter [Parolsenella catena]|uniref:DMT family transporter n=1 Tax=Parolsenella catena TaxID=2003188 RepID=UPI003A8E2E4A
MAQRQGKGLGRGAADALLAVIACAWGSSYLLMKVGTGAVPPFSLIALRFGIAFVVVAAIFSRRLAKTRVSTLVRAAVLGALMFALFGFLMTGIGQTSASNAGFLTSLAVVFVPVINAVVRRRAPGARMTAGVAVTLLGIALLSLHGSLTLSPGDALCVMGSIFYALFIVATDRLSAKEGPLLLGVWQLGFAALFGLVATNLFEAPALPADPVHWGAVLGLALVCSAFGFVAQPVAQRATTAEHAALLFALEPVSSAVLAFVFLGETLDARGMLGAVLVIAGVLVASLPARRRSAISPSPETGVRA